MFIELVNTIITKKISSQIETMKNWYCLHNKLTKSLTHFIEDALLECTLQRCLHALHVTLEM